MNHLLISPSDTEWLSQCVQRNKLSSITPSQVSSLIAVQALAKVEVTTNVSRATLEIISALLFQQYKRFLK